MVTKQNNKETGKSYSPSTSDKQKDMETGKCCSPSGSDNKMTKKQ